MSTVLLDTCTFIWLVSDPKKLSRRAKLILDAASTKIVLSEISILEICTKWLAGKLELSLLPRDWVEDQVSIWDLTVIPIGRQEFYGATELPLHHKDPFDRLLVATARLHGLLLVTPDSDIAAYPIQTLW